MYYIYTFVYTMYKYIHILAGAASLLSVCTNMVPHVSSCYDICVLIQNTWVLLLCVRILLNMCLDSTIYAKEVREGLLWAEEVRETCR
jgi:hypothetical protein